MPIAGSYLHNITKFCSVISNYDKVMPYWMLVNFYISPEKCDISATVRLISTEVGMIRQNVSEVHGC